MGAMRTAFAPLVFLASGVAAMFAPFVDSDGHSTAASLDGFPGWPSHYEGRELSPLPLSDRETNFLRDFPGRVGRFSDGRREIIVRWVSEPTRLLHPAADCFRGSGYSIAPLPTKIDRAGAMMGCFRATRDGFAMTVCEAVRDEHGRSWPDASSWYWTTMLSGSDGPWWSIVEAETQ
jgi:hypothetical protein